MRTKTGVIVLAVICVALVIALIIVQGGASTRQKKDARTIANLSNDWTSAEENLNDMRQVNLALTNDLASSRQQSDALSNNLTDVNSALSTTKASLENAQQQIASLTSQINQLETQNQELDQRALTLTNDIANLTAQIADTQKKLASAETDKTFLTQELNRLTAEKADLEKKFNDLNVLREQVKKLKEEMYIARRLEWIREGVFGAPPKGAELLTRPVSTNSVAVTNAASRYDLNVEVGSDGSLHVIPPATNSATTNSSTP